jgi:hypothetical protein
MQHEQNIPLGETRSSGGVWPGSWKRFRAQSGQTGVCRTNSDMIISVAIITAGPQLTKAANQSSGLRKTLLSSCMASFSTKINCQRK